MRGGSSLRSRRVVLYLAPGSGSSRATLIAGRRIGGAVARNRARRVLREAWRELGPRVQEGWRAVLVAREPIVRVRTPEMVEELGELLGRAGVLLK